MTASQRLFRFRPLQPADLDLVCAWIGRPHVARWWRGGGERARIELQLMEVMESDWQFPNLVLLGQRPIGYLQYYVAALRAGELGMADAIGVLGVDAFIGEPELTGKGFGAGLLRQAGELLFREPAIAALVSDPDPANEIAIRAYANAGFIALERHPPTAAGGRLMRLDRPPDRPPSG